MQIRKVRATLAPCKVPWAVSPSMSGLTLIHTETDESPKCVVVLAGGRLKLGGNIDSRRIEITFYNCHLALASSFLESEDLESEGFKLQTPDIPTNQYSTWRNSLWSNLGYCPDPDIWVALESEWLSQHPALSGNHYVIVGNSGYIELIASGFSWREWIWKEGRRDDLPNTTPVVASGSSEDSVAG